MAIGTVTINTDAGFYPIDKIGSYAYWIKGDGLFLSGSGVFKGRCDNSTEAEIKSIINAIHILDASGFINIKKLIINRDNIHARSSQNGNELQRKLSIKISQLRKKCNYKGRYPFFEFRHVKAHSHTKEPRNWVNDWCDKRCKEELKKYKKQIKP